MFKFRHFTAFISALCFFFVFAGSAWAQADSADAIKNPTVITVYGVPLEGGGCSYSGTIPMSPQGNTVRQRPIYQDSASCTMVVEQGEPVSNKIKGGTETRLKGNSASATSRNQASAYLLNRNSRAYLHTWLEDPVNADVNSVTSYVNWWWNGYYVVGSFSCSNNRWWLSSSGWREDSSNLACYYYGSKAVSSTYSHFTNPYFCAAIDTHAVYNRNTIRGAGNGWWYADWNVRWDGGCWWLLSFSWEAGYV